jgi:plastocyanin
MYSSVISQVKLLILTQLEKINYLKFLQINHIVMTDWDLLTPGIGLTSIGIVGVGIALSGIAKTFLDGMHAVSLLTMFFGMIFLASGLFKDGFPTSGRAKSATFITLGFLVTFGFTAAVTGGTQTPSIYAYIGLMMLISIPATVLVVASYKRTPYIKALAVIFIGAAIVGGSVFYAFGLVTPKTPSAGEEQKAKTLGNDNQEKKQSQQQTKKPVELTKVTILPGASAQGNPSYDPADLKVPIGVGIQWINNDNVPHTVTSLKDDGKSFDSSIIAPNGNYTLDTSALGNSEYEYFCTLHPYMKAKFIMSTGAASSAPAPTAQNNSSSGNISTVGSEQTTEATMNNTSIGNSSRKDISIAKINNYTNEQPQAPNTNETSATNKTTSIATSSISTVSIASGSSLPSNREFYVPKIIETSVGSMITWKNEDFTPHTVTSGNMNTGKTGIFDSNIMQKGSTFSFLFDKIGDYNYFCTIHPFMTGRIVVK